MNNHKTYTQAEIQSNINKLQKNLDLLVLNRKSLNSDIRNVKKQIEYWNELDSSQYKMF